MLRSFHIYLSRCLVALPLIAAGCISFGHKSTDCGPAGCQTGSCETGACSTGGCNNSPYDPTCGVQPCGGNKWGWKNRAMTATPVIAAGRNVAASARVPRPGGVTQPIETRHQSNTH